MIGPIISLGVIGILIVFFMIFDNNVLLVDDIKNETLNDIKWHKSNIEKIYHLFEINNAYYDCGRDFNCSNITYFVSNVNACANSHGYNFDLHYDGQFYIYVDGYKDILSEKDLCG